MAASQSASGPIDARRREPFLPRAVVAGDNGHMALQPENSKQSTVDRLVDSMLELVRSSGPSAASVRAISRGAGVTEAMLYRYFPSKEAMFHEVWYRRLQPLVLAKVALLERDDLAPRDVLEAWVRLTFEEYDANPAAFHFVLLADDNGPWRRDDKLYRLQSESFRDWLENSLPNSLHPPLTATSATRSIAAMLLAVPRAIESGSLEGPAIDHVDATIAGIERLLRLG